ncbi:AMP-binding protein [Rhodococcus sp. NPDC003318]|uniref:class I adenylate-forming enzyme family protein n=1 Tax=Rhodococcus sp. NPDC003318 TaxID=3364503 RepID=UPI0036B830CD
MDELARTGEGPDAVELTGDELSLVIYTSGSTGRPKGVMLDHSHVEAMSSTMSAHLGLTGDVGILDADGSLRIVDRLKDMIIRGGENINPKEIEAVVTELDDVLEAAVVGGPDTVLGEVPIAHVSLYPGSTLTPADLARHCRAHLTRVKVPERIEIVEALPKNPVGKIDKPRLRPGLHPA